MPREYFVSGKDRKPFGGSLKWIYFIDRLKKTGGYVYNDGNGFESQSGGHEWQRYEGFVKSLSPMTATEVYNFRPLLIDGMASDYYGIINDKREVEAFSDPQEGPFAMKLLDNGVDIYEFKTDKHVRWQGSIVAAQSAIKNGIWQKLTNLQFENLIAEHRISLQPQKPMAAKINVVINPGIAARPTVIRKSGLYVNTTTNQVERVLTVQDGVLVWSSHHKQEAKAYPKSAFRLATQLEVNSYLGK